MKHNTAMLRLLILSGVRVKILYEVHLSAFEYPAFNGEISLIHEAASLGAVSAIAVLLEYCVEIDAKSPTYGTALMVALWTRQEEAAEFLLSRGANPNFNADSDISYRIWRRQGYCWNPIDAAIMGGKPSMVKLLLDQGAVPQDSTRKFALLARLNRIDYSYFGENDYKSNKKDKEIIKMVREVIEHEKKKRVMKVAEPEDLR